MGATSTGSAQVSQKVDSVRIAVEHPSSPVLSGKRPGFHKIQAIGAGFIPQVLNVNIIDEVISVTDEEAIAYK